MFQLMSWSWHPLVSGPCRLQLKLPQDVVVFVVGVVAVVDAVVIVVVVLFDKTSSAFIQTQNLFLDWWRNGPY